MTTADDPDLLPYYGALFPSLYSAPRPKDRQWASLKLPTIRMFGPMWSFSLRVRSLDDERALPGLDPRSTQETSRALRALLALEQHAAHKPLEKFHAPTLLRAEIDALLQVEHKDVLNLPMRDDLVSQASLLALQTIDWKPRLRRRHRWMRECLPVSPYIADSNSEDPAQPLGNQQSIIISPLGSWPAPQEAAYDEDGTPLPQYLAAMQLMHGKIRFRPHAVYLQKVRNRMGLAPPSDGELADADTIVLLPDGFCVAGHVRLPWNVDGEDVAAGWFKATYRNLDAGGGRQRVLRLWIDPLEDGHKAMAEAWLGRLAGLKELLREPLDDTGPMVPRWLHLAPREALDASQLFWPETAASSFLFDRSGHADKAELSIDAEALIVRLADRPPSDRPLSVLTLQPDHFELKRVITGENVALVMSGKTAADATPPLAGVEAVYSFVRGAGSQPSSETLTFDDVGPPTGAGDDQLAVQLALPLVETAEAVRQALGVPRPDPQRSLDLLWVFTAAGGGWLHWPLPNATTAHLARLLSNVANEGAPEPPPRPRNVHGALTFGNTPQLADYRAEHRTWALGLSGVDSADIELHLGLHPARRGEVVKADIRLRDFEMSFDGFASITPFRQQPDRLLPESHERALRSLPLKAVSSNLLRGIERRLWEQAVKPHSGPGERLPQVRVEVLLKDLTLLPTPEGRGAAIAPEARVGWLTAYAGAHGSERLDTARQRPWLWVPHPALPTVQTLPLAAAGRRRNVPSSVRSLAPLQIKSLPAGAEAAYETSLDMSRTDHAVGLYVRRPDHPKADKADLVRPAAAGPQWHDEIGMAVTTLPSATYFVGVPRRPGMVSATWDTWLTQTHVDLRHDIALRDEHHAFAHVPGPPPQGTQPEPRQLFTPRNNNGPEAEVTLPDGTQRLTSNGWDEVWRGLQRRTALAAADRRQLLRDVEGRPGSLTGLFGELDYPLTDVALRAVPTGTTNGGLASIGAFTLTLAGTQPWPMNFAGLPAESDLLGLTGSFRRGDADIAVTFGTPELKRDGQGFLDQYGLRVAVPEVTSTVIVKELRDAASKSSVRLVTLCKPIVCPAGSGDLHFWCADVPAARESQNPADNPLSRLVGRDARANASGPALNHLAGFRWRLYSPEIDARHGLVLVQGLVFEPLALQQLVQQGNELPATVVIEGRLRLPVRKAKGAALPMSDGKATLTLTRTDSTYAATVQASKLTWPLVDPDAAGDTFPTLHIPELPQAEASGDALLRYHFAEEEVVAQVRVTRAANGRLDATLDAQEAGPPDGVGAIDFRQLVLTLAPAVLQDDGSAPVAPADAHRLDVEHRLAVGPAGARIVGKVRLDVLSGKTLLDELQHAFSDKDYVPLVLSGAAEDNTAFGPQHFALCWKAADENPRGRLWGALPVAEAHGAVFAAIARKPPTGDSLLPSSYAVIDLETRGRFVLKTPAAPDAAEPGDQELELRLDRSHDKDGAERLVYRLSGRLELVNAFSWPVVEEIAPHKDRWIAGHVPADWTDGFSHRVTLRFDGQGLPPQMLAQRGSVALAVDAEHKVVRVDATRSRARSATDSSPLVWRTFQIIRFMPLQGLRERLVQMATPAKNANLRKAHTAFSPLLADSAKPLIAQRALPHFLHQGTADTGALSGRLAVLLRARIDDAGYEPADAPLAIDFSHHALLAADRDGSVETKLAKPLLLVGLPALGTAGVGGGNKPLLPPPHANDVTSRSPDEVELRRLLDCRPSSKAQLYLAWADRYGAHEFPRMEPALATQSLRRITDARSDPARRAEGLAAAALADRTSATTPDAQQPVFQPVVFRYTGPRSEPLLTCDDLPTAGTAFHLSELFSTLTDRNPLAVAFGVRAPLRMEDFRPGDYPLVLENFRKAATGQLVPGPDALPPVPAERLAEHRLELATISRDGQRVMALAAIGIDASVEGLDGWVRRTLARNAPWATIGVLVRRTAAFGFDEGATAHTVTRKDPVPRRIERQPGGLDQVARRQPQFELLNPQGAAEPGLAPGYVPVAAHAAFLRSEGDPVQPGSTDGPRLAASGATRAWALTGGAGAMLERPHASSRQEFWITDRETVAMREARHEPTGTPFELTFALAADEVIGLPRSLAPASHAQLPPPESGSDEQSPSQAFAPAFIHTTRIGSRAGVWSSSRTGLIQMQSDGDNKALSWRASETPLHLRLPRPVLLAANDRPRASSHEAQAHVDVGLKQTCIVHGPRAARAGSDLEPVGLNRAPRSKWATRMILVDPPSSIIGPEWDGSITVRVDAARGEAPPAQTVLWRVDSAALLVGDVRYVASMMPGPTGDGSDLRFAGFAGADQIPALAVTNALPAASEVSLMIDLVYEEAGEVTLNRRVRFELFTAGLFRPGRLERPVFIRFEDPEFNDRLGGPTRMARRPSSIHVKDDIVLAADTPCLRADQRVELALALRPQLPGQKVEPFKRPGGRLLYGPNDEQVWVTVGRRRRADPDKADAKGDEVMLGGERAIAGAEWVADAMAYALSGTPVAASVYFHSLSVDATALDAGGAGAALEPGDQLVVYVEVGPPQQRQRLIDLSLDVVEEPPLPTNPSGFAVLAVTPARPEPESTSAKVSATLYASSPEATLIELVDPRDLIEGVARRRAVYQWRCFLPATTIASSAFALQKVNAAGSTWLPGTFIVAAE